MLILCSMSSGQASLGATHTLPKEPLPRRPPSRTSSKGTSSWGSCVAMLPVLPPLVGLTWVGAEDSRGRNREYQEGTSVCMSSTALLRYPHLDKAENLVGTCLTMVLQPCTGSVGF